MNTTKQTGTITPVEARPATEEDRAALLAFYEEFEPRPASLGLPPRTRVEGWLEGLAGSPNFVAEREGRLVGHAVLCPEGERGEVAVFVHQGYRNQGIGRQLLTALVEEGRRRKLRRLWGVTELDNLPMLRLAHSLGFVAGTDLATFHLDLETDTEAGRTRSRAAPVRSGI